MMSILQDKIYKREGCIMCGRYYIDSDMIDEIEKVVRDIDQRISHG